MGYVKKNGYGQICGLSYNSVDMDKTNRGLFNLRRVLADDRKNAWQKRGRSRLLAI